VVDDGDLVFVLCDEDVFEAVLGVDEIVDVVEGEDSLAGQFPDDGAGWQVGGEVGGVGSLVRGSAGQWRGDPGAWGFGFRGC